jgi:3-hydroxyisobutyrate dehydrogenase-like beta-hydroxyacid dehydrogenase
MSDVTVIGLGEMGSALARAFITGGRSVTVWNRSPRKTAPLEQIGASVGALAAGAIHASPVVVICLSDYDATHSVLGGDGAADALAGHVVVQLSSGTPEQARTLDAWITARGATYLDGAIAAWPRQIGGPEAAIVLSGPEPAYRQVAPLLGDLAGEVTYLGADIGHAMAMFNAGLAYLAGHRIGFGQAAAIAEAEGLDVGQFGEMMAAMAPSLGDDLRHMARVVATDRFGNPESTVRTVGADLGRLAGLASDLRIDDAFPALAADLFRRTNDAGFGGEEHVAVIKVLRGSRRH